MVAVFVALLFSCPVVSNSLWTHGLQHNRPPCPSSSPRVCPSSCSLHRWCCPAISSSDALFSFCPRSSPASESHPMSHLFASDDQNPGASTSASVCQANVSSSVLCHVNKDLEWRTLKPWVCHSSWVLDRPCYSSQVSNRQISVTALCYSAILFRKWQGNPSWRREGISTQRREEKRAPACLRERPRPFGSSFCMFFSPLGLPYIKRASQECLFYPRSSLRSSDLPLFYFRRLFSSF